MFDNVRNHDLARDDRPLDLRSKKSYEMIRAEVGLQLKVIVLSEWLYGYWQHFVGGKNVAHRLKNCEGCAAGIEQRWYGYLCVMGIKSGDIAVLQLTAKCYQRCEEYFGEHNTLRGAHLTVTRRTAKKNAKVMAVFRPSGLAPNKLPEEIEVELFPRTLWSQHRPDQSDLLIQQALPISDVPQQIADRLAADASPTSNGRRRTKKG